MRSKLGLIACIWLSLCLALHGQTTIHVPADQPTVQAGINAANPGDTVLVAPGTYNENIDFKGKAITVTSSGGPTTSILNAVSAVQLPTVQFIHGETNSSVLNGFTIQNGGTETVPGDPSGITGGIYLFESAPTISNNVITHNHCNGIYSNASSPLIQSNEIDNTLDANRGCGIGGGSAIWLDTSLDYDNDGPTSSAPPPVIVGNTIQNNTQAGKEADLGAAVVVTGAQALIESNIIRNNTTVGDAAINATNTNIVSIIGNLIYNNTAKGPAAIYFEPIETDQSEAGPFVSIIASNTIAGNQSGEGDGSPTPVSDVALDINLSQVLLINNLIIGSTPGKGAFACTLPFGDLGYTPLVFDHNDIFNTTGPAVTGVCPDPTGTYGNLSVDPRFVNAEAGDLHLQPGSAAIDTGNNSAPLLLPKDIAGAPRIQDATGLGHPVVDMGAYEMTGVADTTATTLTLTPSTYYPGSYTSDPFTLTARVAAQNGAIPAGPVTFYEDLNPIGTQTLDAAASTTLQPKVLPGLHAFLATFPGQGSLPPAVSVKFYVLFPMATPALVLSSSPNPSALNAPVTFTLQATSSDGVVPSPITLTDTSSNTVLATLTPDSTGTATFTTSTLALGTHLVTASFAGSSTDNPASSSVTQVVVNGSATTTTLTSSLNPSSYGQPVSFTAHVASSLASNGIPTGSITFLDGSHTLATVPLDGAGTASLTTSALTASRLGGSHIISATYTPAGGFGPSSASLNQIVNGLPTVVSLDPAVNSATIGYPVILTTTVSPASLPGPAPVTGTITYFEGSTTLGTATLVDNKNVVIFSISSLPAGLNTLTCTYNGSTIYAPSSCSPVTVTITGSPTTTALIASPNPAYVGQTVTLTATVNANGTSALSGTLTFYDGTSAIGTGTLNASGQATSTTNTLAPGTHTLTASYPTSGALIGSTSPPVSELILPSGFALSLSPQTLTVQAGQKGTVSINLTSLGNFAGPLALTFGTLPNYASGTMIPATVTLAAGGTGTTNLLLTTSTVSANNTLPTRPGAKPWPLVLSALLLLPLGFTRSKRPRSVLCLCFAAILLQSLTGCTTLRVPFDLTAAGTYQIPITATGAAGHTQTATLTLVITP